MTIKEMSDEELYRQKARLLPKEQFTFEQGHGYIIAGLWEWRGYRCFVKYRLSELPNDLVSLDDLKRVGIVLRCDR
jgi:hypothetical protein